MSSFNNKLDITTSLKFKAFLKITNNKKTIFGIIKFTVKTGHVIFMSLICV